MYDEVMKTIHEQIPEQSPENLPTVYPPWEQAPVWENGANDEQQMENQGGRIHVVEWHI